MTKKIISCRLFALVVALVFVLPMINLPVLANEPETEVEEESVEVHYAEEAEIDFSHNVYLGDIYERDEDEFDSDKISLQDAEELLDLSEKDITPDAYVFSEELNAKYEKLDRAFEGKDSLIENEPYNAHNAGVIYLASADSATDYTLGSTVSGTTGTGGQTQYRFISPQKRMYTFRINQPITITLYDSNNQYLKSSYSISVSEINTLTYMLEAGQEYTLSISTYRTISFELTSYETDIEAIELNNKITDDYTAASFEKYYSFVPNSDGAYTLRYTNSISVSIYDDNMKSISTQSRSINGEREYMFYAKGGNKYYISARGISENSVNIIVKSNNITDINLGQESRYVYSFEEGYRFFRFTPSKSGGYSIESTGDVYASAYIMDPVTNTSKNSYGSSGSGKGFATAMYMEADEEYIIGVTSNESGDGHTIGVLIKESPALSGTINLSDINIDENESVSCNIYGVASGTYNTGIMGTTINLNKGETSKEFHIAFPVNPSTRINSDYAEIDELAQTVYDSPTEPVDEINLRVTLTVNGGNTDGDIIFYYNGDGEYTYDATEAVTLPVSQDGDVQLITPKLGCLKFDNKEKDSYKSIYVYPYSKTVRSDMYYMRTDFYSNPDAKVLVTADGTFDYIIKYQYRYLDAPDTEPQDVNDLMGNTIVVPDEPAYDSVYSDRANFKYYDINNDIFYLNTYSTNNRYNYACHMPQGTNYLICSSGVYYTGNPTKLWSTDRNSAQVFNSSIDNEITVAEPEKATVKITRNSSGSNGGITLFAYSTKTGEILGNAYVYQGTVELQVPVKEPYKIQCSSYYYGDMWLNGSRVVTNYNEAKTYTGSQNISFTDSDSGEIEVTFPSGQTETFQKINSKNPYKIKTYSSSRLCDIAYYSRNGMVSDKALADYAYAGDRIKVGFLPFSKKGASLDINIYDYTIQAAVTLPHMRDNRWYNIKFVQYDGYGDKIKEIDDNLRISALSYDYVWYFDEDTKYYSITLYNAAGEIIDDYSNLPANETVHVGSEPVNENNEIFTIDNLSDASSINFNIVKESDSIIKSCNVLVAIYSDDGVLVDVKKEKIIFADKDNAVDVSIALDGYGQGAAKLKIMAWNDANAPLMNAYDIE